jgi:SpoVK/Ycf46/Vps4 family AAA+-type ATPase
LIPVPFGAATFAERRAGWAASLGAAGMTPIGDDLDALASRFRLAPPQIGDAVAVARGSAALRAAAHAPDAAAGWSSGAPSMTDLFRAARAQSGDRLGRLARRIEPKYGWADIVLPADQLARLRELSDQARYRHVVHGDWGFEQKLSLGRGLNALFSGPPGTGKTMAAEVIGRDLELELYAIDLAQVVSKYIGETEKNLQAVFQAAEDSQAILFFDEADALFGKRSEVKDAHDRYANIEIGYLLQKMEAHEGIAILATNLRKNMDEAFLRRMQFTVDFPFPDEESRRRIWDGVFPEELPRARDVDVFFLARQFKLSGGHIRNIALAAAFLAAADRSPLTMAHLIRATRREYQKLGWLCSKADFGAYHALVQDADA